MAVSAVVLVLETVLLEATVGYHLRSNCGWAGYVWAALAKQQDITEYFIHPINLHVKSA